MGTRKKNIQGEGHIAEQGGEFKGRARKGKGRSEKTPRGKIRGEGVAGGCGVACQSLNAENEHLLSNANLGGSVDGTKRGVYALVFKHI